MGKKIKIRIRDEHPGSYFRELETVFRLNILKFFDADPDPGSGIFLNLNLESRMKNFGFGFRDIHPGYAPMEPELRHLHI